MAKARVMVLDAFAKRGVGAEIGVFKGRFSRMLLKHTKPKKLYLIDPWENFDDPGLADAWYHKSAENDMEAHYTRVTERFSGEIEAGQVSILRGKTVDVADEIADQSLDYVYIDGDHRFEAVAADLEVAAQKIMPGGLIALDDHHLRGWWGDGVVRAACEFLGKYSATMQIHTCIDRQLIIKRRVISQEDEAVREAAKLAAA
ncbi:MAG: class I SAM-dependent methyltransferase [Pseudomonadota bacterium]